MAFRNRTNKRNPVLVNGHALQIVNSNQPASIPNLIAVASI